MKRNTKSASSTLQLIPGFQTVRLLSEGTYSSVLLLKKLDTGVLYVLKMVPEFLSIDVNQENHVEFEKRVLATCNPHPFLVQFFSEWSPKVGSSLVLEYLSGGSLFALLRQQHRLLTEKELLFYAAEISLALGRLHQFGYVCRDLKLESILLDELGHIHLTNFGISGRLRGLKAVLPSKPETYERLISIAGKNTDDQAKGSIKDLVFYVAPETLNGKGHNASTDWWALGILLYCACLGKTPYEHLLVESSFWENCEATLRYTILNFQVDMKQFPSCYSKELVDFICRLLHPNHLERLGSGPGDVEELWQHPFLARAVKDAFLLKQVKPPLIVEPNDRPAHRNSFLQRPLLPSSMSFASSQRMSLPEMFSRLSSSPRLSLVDEDAAQGQKRASKEIKRILTEDGLKDKSMFSSLNGLGKTLKRTLFTSSRSRSNSLVLGTRSHSSSVAPSPNTSLDQKLTSVLDSLPLQKETKNDRGHFIFPPGIGAIPWQPLRDANR